MIKIKEFLNNEGEEYINNWMERNINEDNFIDIKFASVYDGYRTIRDRIIIVYKCNPDTETVEVE